MHQLHRLCALALPALLLLPSVACGADPLATMSAFCRADGLGARLTARAWQDAVAPLVTWELEPAWDHVYSISGYEIGPPRLDGSDVVVEVSYTILTDISAGGAVEGARLEAHTFRLIQPDPNGEWRVAGPPPAPHVFASEIDEKKMAAALDPQTGSYVSNSSFIWEMLRAAGWAVPYLDTAQLATAPQLTHTESPMFGDVVVYYDGANPYHVGFIDEDQHVLSATLNAGLRRTIADAFPGEHRYFRFRALPETPTPGPALTAEESTTPAPPAPQRDTSEEP